MKKILFITTLALSSLTIKTQVTEDWVSQDDYYGKDGIMVVVDADDNAFTLSDIFNGDIYLTKRSTDGTILWAVTYDNTTPSQWEVASCVAIDINGDAIVTGYTNTGFGTDWYPVQVVTMKFNGEDGALLWRRTYNTGSAYRGRKVLTDAAGNIYVGGDVNAWMIYHGEVGNMMLKKYDTDGNEIWSIIANDLGNPIPGTLNNLEFDAAGNIVIASYGSTMAKISPSGNIIWYLSGIENGIVDIDLDPSGNIFVLSHGSFGVIPFISTDFTVKKYNSSGTLIWSQHYDFGNEEFGRQIECDNSGGAYIIGYGDLYFDWITFKINSTGILQWSQIYDEHTGNDEIPKMMVKDDDDNIYVTGQGGPWPGYFWTSLTQMVTIKYTPDGVAEWTALHDYYTNVGTAICLASDNSIYAVAQMYATTIHYTQVLPTICETPVGLFTNNITTTKARLNWTVDPDAFQYEVWYKKTTAAVWKKKFVPGINNKLNLKNLQCNKNYEWQIRTICDTVGVDIVSDFSAVQNFTTLICRDESIVMEDNISIYPNPAVDVLNIYSDENPFKSITILDLSGKVLLIIENTVSGTQTIDVSNLTPGMYLIRLETDENIINDQFIISK